MTVIHADIVKSIKSFDPVDPVEHVILIYYLECGVDTGGVAL